MFVSISSSFYKRGHLVKKVYEQILSQTYTNWEWVVTDDFSEENDATPILKELALMDPRVKYYEQSRKKELFYNPHFGCKGDVVVQIDTDDVIMPKLLEVYVHNFTKFPDVMGMCCGWNTYLSSGAWSVCSVFSIDQDEIWSVHPPMARAFRNVFPQFDDGTMRFFQNDVNIVRYTENYGKFLYLPRSLYSYTKDDDSVSHKWYSDEDAVLIENERLMIEHRFGHLSNPNSDTWKGHYMGILNEASALLRCDNVNNSSVARKILYVDSSIKPYKRGLLKELFYDHYLSFSVRDKEQFDTVVVNLGPKEFDNLERLVEVIKYNHPYLSSMVIYLDSYAYKWKNVYGDTPLYQMDNDGLIPTKLRSMFGNYGFHAIGYSTYVYVAL